MSGFCVFFVGCLVSWGSKKQSIISRSSTEVEYRCLALVATELVWICSFLCDIGISLTSLPVLWCDNLSTVHLSVNPVLHSKTKHVDLDIYIVRDLVFGKKLSIHHLPAIEQVADIFAKSLSVNFLELKQKLTVVSDAAIDLQGGC